MVRKKTRKSPARRSRKRSTSSKKSTTLNSSQKSLKQRQKSPWDRLKLAGYSTPIIYQFPWEDRALSKVAQAEYFPGIGYVSLKENPLFKDYRIKNYSW